MEHIKAQVHMLPTDKAVWPNCMWLGRISGQLHLDKSYENKVLPPVDDSMLPQYLYFTTDEEIKEGDWCLQYGTTLVKVDSINKQDIFPFNYHFVNPDLTPFSYAATYNDGRLKKIVATTNPELWSPDRAYPKPEWLSSDKGIAKIDESFILKYIEMYNAGTPVTDVMLETEWKNHPEAGQPEFGGYDIPGKNILKLKPNGSVIVKPVKEKMYTRQELMDKLLELNPQIDPESKYTNPFIYKHIKQWYNELKNQ